MYKDLQILAVVPARGGSKGIPLKNIISINGVSLVGRVALLLQDLDFIDDAVLSSDNEEIVSSASSHGLLAPFRRPAELSGDQIGDFEVLKHALFEIEKTNGKKYDVIIMLQPTSPMRQAHHIVQALNLYIQGQYDAVWSVSLSDTKNHPLKQLGISNNELDYYDAIGSQIIARQQLSTLYQRNGIVYVIGRKCLTEFGDIKGNCTGAYVVSEHTVSIDTIEDIEYVEFLMEKHGDPLYPKKTDISN